MAVPNEFKRSGAIAIVVICTIVVFIIIGLLVAGLAILIVNQMREGKDSNRCDNNAQCNSGYSCVSGACKGDNGTFCRKNDDCVTGNCNTSTTVCE